MDDMVYITKMGAAEYAKMYSSLPQELKEPYLYYYLQFQGHTDKKKILNLYKDLFACALDTKTPYIYLTALAMIINHKSFELYEDNPSLAKLYSSLWQDIDRFALDTFKGDELRYFLKTTD